MNSLQAPNLNLNYLNEKYRLLSPTERIVQFYKDFRQEDILVTSSFGTSSAILLHLVAQVNPSQEVHFIDTTYLFDETHAYKQALKDKLGLKIISILPEQWKSDFTTQDTTWKKDPNLCCAVNKVEPFDEIKKEYKVWVSGLMAYQTPFRKGLEIFEKDGNIIKFYPIVDVAPYFVRGYFTKYDLPQHPLLAKGYSSVGCKHCTEKGDDRSGRWRNTAKTECGLHIRKPQ